jgi:hypothetical protein
MNKILRFFNWLVALVVLLAVIVGAFIYHRVKTANWLTIVAANTIFVGIVALWTDALMAWALFMFVAFVSGILMFRQDRIDRNEKKKKNV